jgi:hypothetical protein
LAIPVAIAGLEVSAADSIAATKATASFVFVGIKMLPLDDQWIVVDLV